MLKKLPIGIQDFISIREDNYLYVDKTDFLYRLVQEGKVYFLYRLRRFALIIKQAHEQTGKRACVIINEYDKPLLSTIDNPTLHEEYKIFSLLISMEKSFRTWFLPCL